MPRVIPDPGEPLDELGDARQGPQVRPEPVRPRSVPQRRVDPGQLLMVQSRPPTQPTGRRQTFPTVLFPRLIPVVRGLPADPKPRDHHGLRRPPREQARRREPTGLQRGNLPFSGHVPTWHRSL
jgi:hypothetical protein